MDSTAALSIRHTNSLHCSLWPAQVGLSLGVGGWRKMDEPSIIDTNSYVKVVANDEDPPQKSLENTSYYASLSQHSKLTQLQQQNAASTTHNCHAATSVGIIVFISIIIVPQ